jgi:type IV pilus assembly protein PilV
MYNATNFVKIKNQHGFTMLEALLTLFVLTIGVLGVAGLQMRAMSAGGTAMQRTMVLMKSQELLERMRANTSVLASYNGAGAGVNGNCNDGVTVCTAATQASHDLFMWRQDLLAMLPSVTGTPIVVAGTTVTITVNWTDKTDAWSYAVTVNI